MDGRQDEADLDPDPLPQTWRDEVDGHIRENDLWINNAEQSRTTHFMQRDVLMEPRRLRSAGMQRPLMIPDVFKRGGPRVQEQTFGSPQTREAVNILQNTTVITEQEAKAIISRLSPRKPINIATIGLTASEARTAELQRTNHMLRSPSQSIGPSQKIPNTPMSRLANQPTAAGVRTITQTQQQANKDHHNAAWRIMKSRRPRKTG